MWMGTQEEKEEMKRAEVNLRRMKEIEERYEAERLQIRERTEYGGVRIRYVKEKKS